MPVQYTLSSLCQGINKGTRKKAVITPLFKR
jgi:hypothetical protein